MKQDSITVMVFFKEKYGWMKYSTGCISRWNPSVCTDTVCFGVAVERGSGEQREVAHRRASGRPSGARRVSAEGSSAQRGDEPHRGQRWDTHSRHRCTLHGEQVGYSFLKRLYWCYSIRNIRISAAITLLVHWNNVHMYIRYIYVYWAVK